MATIPPTGNMPFIRTDFSNDVAWNEVVAAVEMPSVDGFLANLHIINQSTFDSLSAESLCVLAADTHHPAIFVADEITMTNPERHVLCIHLKGTGRSFRIVPEEIWGVEHNLSLTNVDFDEFADAVDDDGVFRGI